MAAYQGFRDYPISKSAWANWKPAHPSGWNVQIVWQPLINPFTNAALKGLESELKASEKVSSMQVQAMTSVTDVPQEIQMMQTAIQRKPDLIILFPAAPNAFIPAIAQAAKAGIPVISEFENTPSQYAVSVNINFWLAEAIPVAALMPLIGEKGDLLGVHGIPGIAGAVDSATAWKDVLSRCPNVHLVGTVFGEYTGTVAKAQVQQYLATHPAQLAGVIDEGVMGPGILGAFSQTGRTPPPLADGDAAQGVLAYWHEHPSYKMTAMINPDVEVGQVTGEVALKMLEGAGVKINTLLSPSQYLITPDNLNQVWKPSFQVGSLLDATPPPGQWFPAAYLNGFFAH
ncbi:MAG TPA: substrate-binding domain-containing protein [Solirubrobacteraceae bacterium]